MIDRDGGAGRAAYTRQLAEKGVDPNAMTVDAAGTIFAVAADPVLPDAIAALPILVGDDAAAPATPGAAPPVRRELKMKARLGAGGMGQVRLAEQVPLAREVAVKLATVGAGSAAAARREAASSLLREARMTGALEHPNIVPVHALGRDADGNVLLVMKRIDGKAWSTLLEERRSCADDLERHVSVLREVCRATHFAHSRGVLHRDLKPANVMVGPFGEVYVVDWGISVCFGHGDIPGAAHAKDIATIAGSPAFMAPEMTLPGAQLLDARTDVYLLGAILHVILTGRPPHSGATVADTLYAAHVAAPPHFDANVPDELAALCTRALAKDPNERPQTADAVHEALVAFSSHASARAISADAAVRARDLVRLVAAAAATLSTGGGAGRGGPTPQGDVVGADLEIHRVYAECRFGFEHALRVWPGSSEAAAGLCEIVAVLARHELARGHADAARVLIAELRGLEPHDATTTTSAPSAAAPVLSAALAQLDARREAQAAEQARLARIAHDVDISLGRRRRNLTMLAVGAVWGSGAVAVDVLAHHGVLPPFDARSLTVGNVLVAVGFLVGAMALRRRRSATRIGVLHLAAAATTMFAVSALWVVVAALDGSVVLGLALAHVMMALGLGFSVLLMERRLLLSSVLMSSGAVLVPLFPAHAAAVNGLVTAAAMIGFAAYNPRRSRAEATLASADDAAP